MLTLEALFAQPDNASVLRRLQLSGPADVLSFRPGAEAHPLDEGGQIFFDRYGRRVPPATHCRLDIVNLMVHERTARIFALHEGRCTIAVRHDLTPDADHAEGLIGYTADADVDLSDLGPGWVLLESYPRVLLASSPDRDDDDAPFLRAYELAGR